MNAKALISGTITPPAPCGESAKLPYRKDGGALLPIIYRVSAVNHLAYNNVADTTRLTNRFGAKPHTVAHRAFTIRGTDKSAVGNTTFHIVLWRQRTNGNAIMVK